MSNRKDDRFSHNGFGILVKSAVKVREFQVKMQGLFYQIFTVSPVNKCPYHDCLNMGTKYQSINLGTINGIEWMSVRLKSLEVLLDSHNPVGVPNFFLFIRST